MVENTKVKSDIEIAQEAKLLPIQEIAEQLDLTEEEWEPYGRYKAKISLDVMDRLKDTKDGKVVLVTSINPTPAGEGKSTVTVGLGQALNKIGKKAVIALREPSLYSEHGNQRWSGRRWILPGYADGGNQSSLHWRYPRNHDG